MSITREDMKAFVAVAPDLIQELKDNGAFPEDIQVMERNLARYKRILTGAEEES